MSLLITARNEVIMKDKIQMIITVSAWIIYCYLVITGKANVEGYIALTVYIVKKALDLIEENDKPT